MFALSVTVLAVNDDTVYYIEEVGVGYNIRSCRKMINRVRYIHIVSFLSSSLIHCCIIDNQMEYIESRSPWESLCLKMTCQ